MASTLLSLSLLVLLIAAGTVESSVTKRSKSNPTDFIKSSCKATRYPVACVQSLSGYANAIRQSDQQLTITALSVSVSRAQSCASFVKKMGLVKGMKPMEYSTVRDCIDNMNDSVDRLNQSVKEFGLVGKGKGKGKDLAWHMSNVQTWVSAAITDQATCLDGFDGPHVDRKLNAAIRPKVVDVSQVTSNALAFVNRFASRHRAAAALTN
ncbi:21 kDa protein-like [Abrus precatorius]|uniref:21 kDa protein-like n=1 Tax=Abrus precatorius TaxID=3816 RepID=A0A8B8K143_ABRPR|nr:21 kDa protein-like [Abrus precatorius]